MPSWVATLLAAFVTVAANALLTAYYYGRLSQKVEGHQERLEAIDESRRDQWEQINLTARGIEKIKGKLGINGA